MHVLVCVHGRVPAEAPRHDPHLAGRPDEPRCPQGSAAEWSLWLQAEWETALGDMREAGAQKGVPVLHSHVAFYIHGCVCGSTKPGPCTVCSFPLPGAQRPHAWGFWRGAAECSDLSAENICDSPRYPQMERGGHWLIRRQVGLDLGLCFPPHAQLPHPPWLARDRVAKRPQPPVGSLTWTRRSRAITSRLLIGFPGGEKRGGYCLARTALYY